VTNKSLVITVSIITKGNGLDPILILSKITSLILITSSMTKHRYTLIIPILPSLAQQAWTNRSNVQPKSRQSNRTRNWFAVDWNLFALKLSINLPMMPISPCNYLA
jgi:hypothetical protein